jgi:DNA primase
MLERWGAEQISIRETKRGPEINCCCLIHGETHPSFSVNMRTGAWSCFACHARGKSIESLVREIEGLSTSHDVEVFLRTVGTKNVDEIRRDLQDKISVRKALAAKRGKEDFTETDEWMQYAECEHPYLYKRGFVKNIIGANRIGYDAKQRSITIPVFEHGVCRFMYRRFVDPQGKGAYRYPYDTDKSNYLWGLSRGKSKYQGSSIYVEEGALDALWLQQNGYKNSVAILGSFMSEVQAMKIIQLDPKEIVLFFDKDEAGYNATEHAGNLLLRLGARNVYYVRYLKNAGDDPQTCSPKQIAKMIGMKKHFYHFKLAWKVGRRSRIRHLRAIAQ